MKTPHRKPLGEITNISSMRFLHRTEPSPGKTLRNRADDSGGPRTMCQGLLPEHAEIVQELAPSTADNIIVDDHKVAAMTQMARVATTTASPDIPTVTEVQTAETATDVQFEPTRNYFRPFSLDKVVSKHLYGAALYDYAEEANVAFIARATRQPNNEIPAEIPSLLEKTRKSYWRHWARRVYYEKIDSDNLDKNGVPNPPASVPAPTPQEQRLVLFYDIDISELLAQDRNRRKPLIEEENLRRFAKGVLITARRNWGECYAELIRENWDVEVALKLLENGRVLCNDAVDRNVKRRVRAGQVSGQQADVNVSN
jgi:hypothetical protein